ncbi:sensor histidine kinase [Staphylococcus sp. GSSP0090]|nr:sensor histidine kinase [Staphylococcus sp. GSSP0090]
MIRRLKINVIDLSSLVYLIFAVIPLFTFDINGPYWMYVFVFIVFTMSYTGLAIFTEILSSKLIYTFLILHYIGITYFVYSVGPAISLFFFFSAFILPFVLKVKMKSIAFLVFIIVMFSNFGLIYVLEPKSLGYILVMYIAILLITIGNFKQRETIEMKATLEEKNQHINVLIAEQERNRIGQDLHDTLGHVFASLSLKSELAIKLVDTDSEQAKLQMAEVNDISKASLNKVRAIVNDLKAQSFEEEVDSMKALLKNANLKFEFFNAELAKGINPSKQAILAMILREAINNVLKHAQATSVTGSLIETQNDITLTISDNGIGIDDLKTHDLKSIKERVALINGLIDIQSNLGLCISITISRGDA